MEKGRNHSEFIEIMRPITLPEPRTITSSVLLYATIDYLHINYPNLLHFLPKIFGYLRHYSQTLNNYRHAHFKYFFKVTTWYNNLHDISYRINELQL